MGVPPGTISRMIKFESADPGYWGRPGYAVAQWRIAAQQPPHLSCIAPWEGTGDLYREDMFQGGIPGKGGGEVFQAISGIDYMEDVTAMAKRYPLMNEYWEDKIPKWENIKVPTYTTVCWNHFHVRGSMEGFRKIRSPKKWLRAHREFEWPDTYSNASLQDLQLFFDRYLKDLRNGWELTPRVRLEVLDAFD